LRSGPLENRHFIFSDKVRHATSSTLEDTLQRDNNNFDEFNMAPPSSDEILCFHSSRIIFNEEEADLIILKRLNEATSVPRTQINKDFI
jgi:hypothetical protein